MAVVLLPGCSSLWTDPPNAGAPESAETVAPPGDVAASESPPTTPAPAASPQPRSSEPPPLDKVAVRLEPIAQLDGPTAMAIRRGDDALYFAERPGFVKALTGQVDEKLILDISDEVSTGGEQGLLGLAFSADGKQLFVSYTNRAGDSRLDAYPMSDDGVDLDGRRELLAVEQPYPNHNGGNVVIGPDDMLYLGLGDGGAGGDPDGNAQNPQTLLGKMVRLDPATGKAPADNPFTDTGDFLPEIFALGLRNPWRFSFDRATGDLWLADVGQDSVEEVNVTPARRSAGRNYGWDLVEGSEPYEAEQAPDGAVMPVVEYPTGEEGCAVTGGYVYRGKAIPELQGAYLYSDYCGGWIRAVRARNGKVIDRADLGIEATEVASFGQDVDGELYVLSLGGQVWRLVPE